MSDAIEAHGAADPDSAGGLITANPGASLLVTAAQPRGSSSGLELSQCRVAGGAGDGMVGVTYMPTSERPRSEHSRVK